MAIANIINDTTLSGNSGTGAFVGSTSPSLVTSTIGVASATSMFFTSTAGIIGTTTNDSADAGSVGEYIFSTIPFSSSVSLTTDTAADVTSISLTAGDWDVFGNVTLTGDSTTTVDFSRSWISSTSTTLPDASLYSKIYGRGATFSVLSSFGGLAPALRFSLSGTTTIYLSTQATFAISTADACGGIYAMRVR